MKPQAKPRPTPVRAFSADERKAVLDQLNGERFADQSPRQVYSKLLDEGSYLCSVRTRFRILEENQSTLERRNLLTHLKCKNPELLATGPNEVWSWDITKLKGSEKWTYYYLYVILDIYSRTVVGWMLAHRESSDLAKQLIQTTIEKHEISADQLIIHSDRGPSKTSHSPPAWLIGRHKKPQLSACIQRQSILRKPVQNDEISSRFPAAFWQLRRRIGILSPLLSLVQQRTLSQWNRHDDACIVARRTSERNSVGARRNT